MKQKIFIIILALLVVLSSCKKSPTGPDTDGATTGTISGTVTDSSTGSPIAGASVSTQPATTTATTDSQGNYSISNVTPGSYTVTASASGYFPGSASVTVTAGQTSTCNVALQPVPTTGTISGTVTEEGTGTPISGASVSTQPSTTTVTTDGQGNYTISDVDPGSYTVTASASGYIADSANVTVTAGDTSTANLALQADYSGTWSGNTTQDEGISFTIVNNEFTEFQFGWRIYGIGCNVYATTTITYTIPQGFSGNTFSLSGSGYQMSYSFSGTFNSPTSASGSGTVNYTGSCAGTANFTWSANKN